MGYRTIDATQFINRLGDPESARQLRGEAPQKQEINRDVPKDENRIFRATYRGPLDASTCTDLAVISPPVWDVNFYYRSLGIEAPYKPTKKELRLAYQEVNGQDSERLTYHFKQLLDPDVRKAYDRMPLGSRYQDKYVIEEGMRKLSEKAAEVSDQTGRMVTVEDLIDDFEKGKPTKPKELIPNYIDWEWSYYLCNSRKYDVTALAEWQQLLINAFAKRSVRWKISVGYVGNTKAPFVVRSHEGRVVFFLNENETPTPELANRATGPRKRSKTRKTK
jgi:hypothetical protein